MKGSSIIVWFFDKEPILLVGKESVYVSDLIDKDPKFKSYFGDLIREKEHFTGKDLTAAKMHFSEEATKLETKYGVGAYILEKKLGISPKIHFDTPEETSDGFRVNYRYLPTDFKRGIIKGGKKPRETPLETIVRETAEELGMKIPKNDLIDIGSCLDYNVFSLDITKENYKVFTSRIAKRYGARSGEIFDLKFMPLSEVEKQMGQYNARSSCAIALFKESLHTVNSVATASAASAASATSAKTSPGTKATTKKTTSKGGSRASKGGPKGGSKRGSKRGSKGGKRRKTRTCRKN